ncbi:2-dehydro-3-deoxygalactonokinase [Catalinimonas sp. 4WD22]|uniref:2-dehydro-3-deoxygalactonokinase n=1 Tax=Catalinimonas locisalis TaxID=3133978 RepID=UPI00310132CD
MTDTFISCDWGTSAFRMRLIKTSSLEIMQSIDDPKLGFGQQSLTQDEYLQLFNHHCHELSSAAGLQTIPVSIISGMASSSIGIRNLSYGKLPLPLADLQIPYESLTGMDTETYLISGLATDKDVMRGEEIQVIGAAQKTLSTEKEAIFILPGTHSKHVFLKDSQLITFNTFMTGELFSLLQQHSILRHSIQKEGVDIQDPNHQQAFVLGVQKSAAALLNELFTIRARQILQHTNPQENYAFLSGLLIGNELLSLQGTKTELLVLCADQPLADYYQHAIQTLLPEKKLLLVSTEEATILGHYTLLQQIHSDE